MENILAYIDSFKSQLKSSYTKYVVNGIFHPGIRGYRDTIIWLSFAFFLLFTSIYTLQDTKLLIKLTSPVLVTTLLFGFTIGCNPAGSSKGSEGIPPWLISVASGSGSTQIVGEQANSSNPYTTTTTTGSPAPVAFTSQTECMVFVHPDHLGSVSMLTDGRGVVLTGGDYGGKSHISYKPYGEIHRTDSSGPDVVKYKYTGQEEDRETGLYYYKARYYDPALGRFISPDTMYFKSEPMGMNRYMYVSGNPVKYTDPTGHKNSKNQWIGAAIGYIYGSQSGLGAEKGAMIGYGFGSGPRKNLTYDKLMGELSTDLMVARMFDPNDKSLTTNYCRMRALKYYSKSKNRKGSDFKRSDLYTMQNWYHPMNSLGMMWASLNYIGGNLAGLKTKIYQDRYGFHLTDAPYMIGEDTGINMGYFSVQAGKRENTTRHENGHKKQYSHWGGTKYTSFFGLRLFGKGGGWPENNADNWAGTWAYDGTLILLLSLKDNFNKSGLDRFISFLTDYTIMDNGYLP